MLAAAEVVHGSHHNDSSVDDCIKCENTIIRAAHIYIIGWSIWFFFIFELNKENSFQILRFLDILQELSMYSNSCQIKKKIPTVIKLNGSPDMFQRHIQMTKFKCIPPP